MDKTRATKNGKLVLEIDFGQIVSLCDSCGRSQTSGADFTKIDALAGRAARLRALVQRKPVGSL
jgi:hypothetical protein